MEKRKDNKGRILKTGESQRKDLIYQYRYTGPDGKRVTIYDSDLKALREREKELQKLSIIGANYSSNTIKVIELVEKYINLRQGARRNTKEFRLFTINTIKRDAFGNMQVRNVTMADAQEWVIRLNRDGKSYCSIKSIRGVVKPAFKMAVNEGVIYRNPFDFQLSDVIKNDMSTRTALTQEQQNAWMSFIKNDPVYSKHYDEFVVLLGTGLRISEFCGLTLNDIDFENQRINVDHQLCKSMTSEYFVENTKTKCGIRTIPMSSDVYDSLKNIVSNRIKSQKEYVVDGYTNFLNINRYGNPCVSYNYDSIFKSALKRYNKYHADNPLPKITPHIMRHTFCTNMINAGVNIKTVQYLMGHSTANITLNIYSHSDYDSVVSQVASLNAYSNLKHNTISV